MDRPVAIAIASVLAVAQLGCAYTPTVKPVSMTELRGSGMTRQSYEFTCGAASLATVAGLGGVELDEAGSIAHIYYDRAPRTGEDERGERYLLPMTLEELERGAHRMGFKAVSLRVEDGEAAIDALEDLAPVITRLRIYDDLLHFVVVRGVEEGWILIADPGYGNVRMPLSQFIPRWREGDGVMLAVGTRPFRARRDEAGQLFVSRDAADTMAVSPEVAPVPAYRTSFREVSNTNRIFTPRTGLTL